MDCNNVLEVVSNIKICKTISYGIEPVNDQPSITVRGEKLDFRNLLSRASAGILDLNAFTLPRSSDIPGSSVTEESIDELMNRPTTVLDKCFGASVEEAEMELNRHNSILSEELKKMKSKDLDPSPALDSSPVSDSVPAPVSDPAPAPAK